MAGLCFVVKTKQVWHLFRYDVKRSWPLLAGWLAFLLIVWARALRDPLERPFGDLIDNGVAWASIFAVAAIWAGVGGLFVNDSPTRHSAFWKTRPVPRWALLAAKGWFALLFFIAIPLLLNATWSLRFGFPFSQWCGEVAPQALAGGAVLLLAAAIASLVEDFARYVAWSLAIGIATPLAQGALRENLAFVYRFNVPVFALLVCVAVVSAGVTALAYLKGRRSAAVKLAVSGWVVLSLIGSRDGFVSGAALPATTPATAPGIAAMLSPIGAVSVGSVSSRKESVTARLHLSGLPHDAALGQIRLSGDLTMTSSDSFKVAGRVDSIYYETPLPGIASPHASEPLHDAFVEMWLREGETFRAGGRLEARLEATLYRSRLMGSAPLEAGARISGGPFALAVQSVSFQRQDLRVEFMNRIMHAYDFVPSEPLPNARLVLPRKNLRYESLTSVRFDDSGEARATYLFPSPVLHRFDDDFWLRFPDRKPKLEEFEIQVFALEWVGKVQIPVAVEDLGLLLESQ